MQCKRSVVGAVAFSAGLVFSAFPSVAQEDCLRVTTFDWSSTLIIDPANIVDNSNLLHVNATYEPLLFFNNKFQVEPWLAKEWSVSDDGKTWTFQLVEGVKFHNGEEFTAEDVVYTYRRLIDPETGSPAKAELDFLTDEAITAVDDHTVRFETKEPVALLPVLLATKYAYIIPKGVTGEELSQRSYGTGPYVIENFKADAPRTILQANPNYWQQGKPYEPCVRISGVPDPVTRATEIQSDNTDILVAADATTLPTLEKDPNVELLEAKGAMLMELAMMVDREPFDDVRVRKAMKLVIDRSEMVDTVTLGYGIFGNDNPVPPTSPLAIQDEPIPQQIGKAKELLEEAGYTDGLEVDLYTGATDLVPGMLAMVQTYKEMAAKAGIDVNVVTSPSASFWEDVYLKQPFVTSYWYTRHPVSSLPLGYKSEAKYNETHWNRPEFDQLIEKAAGTTDAENRKELYQKAQRILMEEGGVILPVFASIVSAVRKDCAGFEPHIESRVQFQKISCN